MKLAEDAPQSLRGTGRRWLSWLERAGYRRGAGGPEQRRRRMSSPPVKGFGQGSVELSRWAEEVFAPEDETLREIRERSVREGLPAIAVGKFDGLHLEVLARATNARKAVEIGTLGGYSGVCLLRG